MERLDAEVWFRFNAESPAAAGADIQRLKEAALGAGFDLRAAKVTPAEPGKGKAGWTEVKDGWTHYVPLDADVEH